ncbi:MAG: 5-deoxy-glucuronate isomerase [Candidatus Omnitrophica bacterium]|nr:5-deoxy-glucuronate isomerase [Candidatus Omnitrophota bacterium]
MSRFHEQVVLNQGFNKIVKADKGFKFINTFSILKLDEENSYDDFDTDKEAALVILSGSCTLTSGSNTWPGLGKREDVFSGLPTCIYIPPDNKYSISSKKAEVAVCKTFCSEAHTRSITIINPEDVKINQVGRDNWSREVRIMIGPKSLSKNMIIGETLNPAGNWSGTPAHRHEKDNLPHESLHEELYYFKTDKPQGWGIERIYSKERNINELIYLGQNSVTYMPFGNHQIVAAPGYNLYYLFFLGGLGNTLAGYEDEEHNWIKQEA